jgi:hypothetical protein
MEAGSALVAYQCHGRVRVGAVLALPGHAGLGGLTAVHVLMVFAVDPYSLRSMITGGYDESKSPEARNARPFFWRRSAPVREEKV